MILNPDLKPGQYNLLLK